MSELDTYARCIEHLSQGDAKRALSLARRIQSQPMRAGVLIDAGFAARKASPMREGIRLLEQVLHTWKPACPSSRASILYNIANGYSSVYALRRLRGRKNLVPPNDDDLRKAKVTYREAVSEMRRESQSLRTQVWVNYGNCLSQFGRWIEAIECYRNALDCDPKNSMAAGNLGIELWHAARIAGKYLHDYALEAHEALSQALGPDMHLAYSSQDARSSFERTKAEIDAFIAAHGGSLGASRPVLLDSLSESAQRYIRFCQAHALFLNAWVGDPLGLPAITDEISFGPIETSIQDVDTVPQLLRLLNEIKEAYTTARYLYFVSLERSAQLDELSQITLYSRTDCMTDLNGLYLGLLKSSYVRAFDVLDKVARVIHVYFGIGRRRDPFWNALAVRQSRGQTRELRFVAKPEVIALGNYGLYALADLCIDYFQRHHVDFQMMDDFRNLMTHDFLVVVPDREIASGDQEILRSRLTEQTLDVLHLAKFATLYAVSAVDTSEARKPATGLVVPQVFYTHEPGGGL